MFCTYLEDYSCASDLPESQSNCDHQLLSEHAHSYSMSHGIGPFDLFASLRTALVGLKKTQDETLPFTWRSA
jgi:hypothetical protein